MPISDYGEEAEDEEKLGKTIVQPLSDVHVLDEDEEPLPVKKSIKKTTSKKEEVEEDEGDDEEKNTKINKIITYVILGIVGILIIVACFFAVQYAMDTFLGGNDNKKAPEQTEEPTTPTKDPTNTDANKDDTNNKDDVTDSSAKIAALKKQRETYVQRKADANDKLELAEKDKKDATETLASLEKNELAKAKEAQKKVSTYENGEYKAANDEYERILGNYNAEKDETVKAQLKESLDAALERKNAAMTEYNRLTGEASSLTGIYNEKKETAESKKSKAEQTITEQKNEIATLEEEIKKIDNQLKELE